MVFLTLKCRFPITWIASPRALNIWTSIAKLNGYQIYLRHTLFYSKTSYVLPLHNNTMDLKLLIYLLSLRIKRKYDSNIIKKNTTYVKSQKAIWVACSLHTMIYLSHWKYNHSYVVRFDYSLNGKLLFVYDIRTCIRSKETYLDETWLH